MTSYSTYATARLRLVDGDLTNESDEDRAEQFEQVVRCVASGAMRALLDQARDLSDDDAQVDASQWHSPEEGWELDALDDADRDWFYGLVQRFVSENVGSIIALVNRIAWDPRWKESLWSGDQGMAFYRVGCLLGMEGAGQGVGFRDYSGPADNDLVLGGMPDVTDRLSAWLDTVQGGYPFEGAYVDSSEEPCLLHIGRTHEPTGHVLLVGDPIEGFTCYAIDGPDDPGIERVFANETWWVAAVHPMPTHRR